MKKMLCALLAALTLWSCAAAEVPEDAAQTTEVEIVSAEATESASPEATAAPEETAAPVMVRIGFEDGFALELPEGWLHHPVSGDMAEQGVIYCLSDAEGAGWLYIQSWDTDCADMNALKALIDRAASAQTSGVYAFNGVNFVVYDLTEADVSCCAALLNDKVLNLVFTPQSDAGFMAVAAQILNTFELL